MILAAVNPVLTFAALLGGCVWFGGLVVIAVVVGIARRQLDPASHAAFFRTLGRCYLPIGSGALVLVLGAGGALLLRSQRWDGPALAAAAIAGVLVFVLVAGGSFRPAG